jgi:hypothetical protein
MSDLLPILYQRIADLTSPSCCNGTAECVCNGTAECARFQDRKYRCCERQYCEQTRKFAKEKYGIDLLETGNAELPFMGEYGCTVPPHLRPVCAIHVCSYVWMEKEQTAPEGYVELREQIIAEAKRQGKEWWSCQ